MAAFICKVCGAALELSAGDKICRCGACGVTQTVPLIDDEEKAELCRSAERYRREYRYDKAIALYEELIRAYPTDADLYWSMLLCRYGVELTAGAEGQPTAALNRTQARSLLADEDYRMALRYADREQRYVMEKQAAEIDRTRRRIVELSRGGERYNIYLCFRERDERGLRTPEYSAAKSLYTRLIGDGFSVFCPDITLDDVQGSEWEPYIYSALNTARVMIVVGFSEESFADVWTANVWSRFAHLAAEDSRRVIIPMYCGMEADKLPEALKQYQAVDMTRLGYENDLITSLGNLLGASVLRRAPAEPAAKSEPLLRRAYLHLEDGEFKAAKTAAYKLLEEEPENGEAYLVLLMAEYGTSSLDTLRADFSVSENYRSAMKYGSEGLRFKLRSFLNASLYSKYTALLEKAENPRQYREAAEGFRMLGEYQDSAQLAEKADSLANETADRAEEQRLQQIYSACVAKLNSSNNIAELQNLQLTLAQLGDYRDCREMASACASKIAMLSAQQRAVDAGYYNHTRTANARKVTAFIISAAVMIVIAALAVLVGISNTSSELTDSTYIDYSSVAAEEAANDGRNHAKINAELNEIEKLIQNGESTEALQRCVKLQQGELTKEQEQRVMFLGGRAMLEMGNYEDAMTVFESLGDYNNSDQWVRECHYRQAVELMQQGDTAAAEEIFQGLDGYSDSADKLNAIRYDQAQELYESGDYAMARAIFEGLGDYSDARQRHCDITCNMAKREMDEGNYTEALELLKTACECDAVLNIEPHCHAGLVAQYISEGDYERAEDSLWALRNVVGFEWVRGDGYVTLIEYYDEKGEDYTVERLLGYLEEIDGYEDVVNAYRNGESTASPSVPDDVMAFGAQMVDNYSVGQVFVFGNFEQNGNTSDGAEPIEWVVIENEDGYLTAMSLRVLTVQPFGTSKTWSDSWLRNYLNMDFYYRAFSEKERSYLSSRELAAVYGDAPLNSDLVIIARQYEYTSLSEQLWIADFTTSAREENERFGEGTEYCWIVDFTAEPWVMEAHRSVSYEGIGEEYHGVRPVITFRKY